MRMIHQLAGPLFVLAGGLHCVIPRIYRRMVPPYIAAPAAMVYAGGAAEIAGGAGAQALWARPPWQGAFVAWVCAAMPR